MIKIKKERKTDACGQSVNHLYKSYVIIGSWMLLNNKQSVIGTLMLKSDNYNK